MRSSSRVRRLLASSLAAAQVLHFACRDGVLVRRLSERRCRIEELGGPCRPVCDTDQTCNGVCTFALRCRPEIGCVSETVTVAVGEKKVVTFYPMSPDGLPRPGSTQARLMLRCRRHPPGIPCPAIHCESDADCPRLLGDPCVQCVGGFCLSNHPCL